MCYCIYQVTVCSTYLGTYLIYGPTALSFFFRISKHKYQRNEINKADGTTNQLASKNLKYTTYLESSLIQQIN